MSTHSIAFGFFSLVQLGKVLGYGFIYFFFSFFQIYLLSLTLSYEPFDAKGMTFLGNKQMHFSAHTSQARVYYEVVFFFLCYCCCLSILVPYSDTLYVFFIMLLNIYLEYHYLIECNFLSGYYYHRKALSGVLFSFFLFFSCHYLFIYYYKFCYRNTFLYERAYVCINVVI